MRLRNNEALWLRLDARHAPCLSARPECSYITGEVVGVTGGRPLS